VESGYQCTLNVGTSEPGIRDWVGRRGEVESGYQCTLNVGTSEPGIRDWVLFDPWIRDPEWFCSGSRDHILKSF